MSLLDDFDSADTPTKKPLLASFDEAATPAPSTPQTANAPTDMPWYEKLIQGVKDPFNATAQLLLHNPVVKAGLAFDKGVFSGGGAFPNEVANSIGDLPKTLDTSIKQNEQDYQAKRGDKGIDWWRAGGNLANPINWVSPGGSGLLASMARGGISSALSMPATSDDFATEKGTQVAVGAGLGGVLAPVANAISNVVSPKISAKVKTLMDAGVTPTPGQIMGGAAQRIEDAATSIPFLGDFIKTAQGRGLSDFNRAVYQRALDPIGEKAPTTIGREAVESIAQKLGDKYDQILPKLSFQPDQQFAHDLSTLKTMASQLPDAQANQFDKIVSAQLGKATPAGLMNGETLKGVTSEILNKSKGYMADPSFDNRQLGAALQELNGAISRTLQRNNPAQAAELNAIDTGWANYARIRAAAASQGAHDGVFTPAQLSAAVKSLDKSVGKGNFAKGNALLQDLSDAGKSVLSQKVPDSGTPLRSLVSLGASGGLGYLAGTHPLAAAGTIGGAAFGALPYTQTGQQAIAALLTKRPDLAPTIANALKLGIPAVAGPGSAALLHQ